MINCVILCLYYVETLRAVKLMLQFSTSVSLIQESESGWSDWEVQIDNSHFPGTSRTKINEGKTRHFT